MRPSESDFAGPSGKNKSWLVECDDEVSMRRLRGERVVGTNSHFLDRLHEGILQVCGYEDILRAHTDLDVYADEPQTPEVGNGGWTCPVPRHLPQNILFAASLRSVLGSITTGFFPSDITGVQPISDATRYCRTSELRGESGRSETIRGKVIMYGHLES